MVWFFADGEYKATALHNDYVGTWKLLDKGTVRIHFKDPEDIQLILIEFKDDSHCKFGSGEYTK